jgi:hypothetical protein
MNGIIHPYYMVALAPGIAALTGIGAMALWQARTGLPGRIVAAGGVLASAVWAYVLLDRTPDWLPWLRWLVVVAGAAAAGLLLAGRRLAGPGSADPGLADPGLADPGLDDPGLAARGTRRPRRARLALAALPLGLALVAGLAGPAAYALDTAGTAHTGAIPSAGPQVTGFGGGPGGQGAGPGSQGGFSGAGQSGRGQAGTRAPNGTARGGTAPGGTGTGQMPGGGPGGDGGIGAGGFGAGGGLGGDTTEGSALTRLLEQDAGSYKWVAATGGSEGAAPLELATGDAVMAIGGFNGTDPWPTLAVFKDLVARHEIHYYVGQGSQSFGGGRGSSAIEAWVAAHFKKQTVGGQTVYDLTKPLS